MIEIYNLDLGSTAPGAGFDDLSVGPFRIKTVPSYEDAVRSFSLGERKSIAWNIDSEQTQREVTHTPAINGKWVVTATATLLAGDADHSVLGEDGAQDNGVWDLCQILTWLTGRQVTTGDERSRYELHPVGAAACNPIETLRAATVAWSARGKFVKSGLKHALLTHNEAIGRNSLQIIGSLNLTALDIVCSKLAGSGSLLPDEVRVRLRAALDSAVEGCDGLGPDDGAAYKAMLGARINQGPNSALDKTIRVLQRLGLVGDPMSDAARRRVRFLNTIRNTLLHHGTIPKMPGGDREVGMRYAGTFATGVIPAVVSMSVGQAFGFSTQTEGSLSQHPNALRRFFSDGIWQGWPLEDVAYEEWFAKLE